VVINLPVRNMKSLLVIRLRIFESFRQRILGKIRGVLFGDFLLSRV